MNSKIAIAVSIFAAILMLIPGVSVASPIQNNNHQYQVGNEMVIINGENTYISFGNGTQEVKWIVELVTSQGIKPVHFTHHSVRRITDSSQNSVVLILNNSQIRVAEVYSFYQGMIDVSAAIQNLVSNNLTVLVGFSLITPHTDDVIANGYSFKTVDNFKNGHTPVMLPSNDWSIDEGNFQITWGNEMSIFNSGMLSTNGANNMFMLAFNPITIQKNYTYTIDPHIRPYRIACPPSDTDNDCLNEPDHDADDGSGGGGGSTGSGPSGLTITVTPINTTPGQLMTIHPSLQSTGSGGVTVYYQAETPVGSWIGIGSNSYGNNFAWTAQYNYHAIRAYAKNSYGTTPDSNTVNTYVYNYPNANGGEQEVLNSTGSVVGAYVLSVGVGTSYTYTNAWDPSSAHRIEFATAAVYPNSDGVWSISQEIKYYGSDLSGEGSNPFQYGTIDNSIQNNGTVIMSVLATYVIGIANSFAFGLIPNPLTFVSQQSNYYAQNLQFYYYNLTGETIVYQNTYYKYTVYDPIWQSSFGPTAYMFGIKTYNDYISSASPNTWQAFFYYGVAITFEVGNEQAPHYFSGSSSFIAQVNVQ